MAPGQASGRKRKKQQRRKDSDLEEQQVLRRNVKKLSVLTFQKERCHFLRACQCLRSKKDVCQCIFVYSLPFCLFQFAFLNRTFSHSLFLNVCLLYKIQICQRSSGNTHYLHWFLFLPGVNFSLLSQALSPEYARLHSVKLSPPLLFLVVCSLCYFFVSLLTPASTLPHSGSPPVSLNLPHPQYVVEKMWKLAVPFHCQYCILRYMLIALCWVLNCKHGDLGSTSLSSVMTLAGQSWSSHDLWPQPTSQGCEDTIGRVTTCASLGGGLDKNVRNKYPYNNSLR